MSMNKLLITKGMAETIDPSITMEEIQTPNRQITFIPKNVDATEIILPKMFLDGYIDDKNSYDTFIGDILIKYHKKEDISKQSIWNTDTSRWSYIVKVLPDEWIKDKNGIVMLDKCIKPLLNYITDLMKKYDKYLTKKIEDIQEEFMKETKNAYIRKYKNKHLNRYDFTSIDSCLNCNEELLNFSANKNLGKSILNVSTQQATLAEMLECINKDNFSKKIIKKITPYFTSDRLKLTSSPSISEIESESKSKEISC